MQLTDLSIGRPVLSTVMSLLIIVAGIAAFFRLPVREYPDVDTPVLSVTTTYPGASPATVESTITEALEQVLNGIEGIRTIESTSALSMSRIGIEFVAGRDIDAAATDVSNAIQSALGELPDGAERPVVRKAGANTFPIIWLSIRGDAYSPVDLTDIADRIVKTPMQVLPGVSQAIIGGERRYAMRIWLDPAEMAAHHVDAMDVRRAVVEANVQLPAGELEAATRKFTVNADAQLDDPRAYENIVIREDGNTPVRIRDVGRVELGSANYQTITRYTANPVVGVGIIRQSRANELAVSQAVRDALPAIQEALPDGVSVEMAMDDSIFVEASLREVWRTLVIAFAVVVLVNLFFLRSGTTTTIAGVAIPVSLIGTFAFMQAFGFSLNLLTLLALVLVIGLLVDDSIVVMENVYRRQESGESRLEATLKGAKEVAFPVLTTTISVVAVLIPLSMMTGNTGRLFREFALTLAAAIGISTFVALTLVPTLCSKFLVVTKQRGRLSRGIERLLEGTNELYGTSLAWSLRHRRVIGLFLLCTVIASGLLLRGIPHTFVPTEDRGRFFTVIRAPQGSTAVYSERAMRRVEQRLLEIPEVAGFFAAVGLGFIEPPNTASGGVFTRLHPWSERSRSQQDIVGMLQREFFAIPYAFVFPINLPSLGQRTISDVDIVLKSASGSTEAFAAATHAILGRLREVPGVVNVDSDLRIDNPQVDILFDRELAADIGVPVHAAAESLRLLLSENPADEFVLRNKQYDVVTALAPRYRALPEQIGEIHVRAAGNRMVPLSTFMEARPTIGATMLKHYDLQRSTTITANLAPGAALGGILEKVQSIVREELPAQFVSTLGGISREYSESAAGVYLTFGIALLVIYLVLSAQFESFVHPLTIMLSVPLALLGALLTLWVTGNTINLYSQIGMILLIGLVTKNSILLVDFANQERARGTELMEALRRAGRTRFRPILMTSMTSVLGALPLALAMGAGAESRRPIGATVVGGLLFSTLFTLVVIPVVHYALIHIAERMGLNTIPPRVELE